MRKQSIQDGLGQSTSDPVYIRQMDGDSTTLQDVVADQIMIVDRGVAKGTQTTTTLVDTDKSWTVDELIGYTVIIHTESNQTEAKVITDNDATSVTVGTVWGNDPVTTVTEYQIRTTVNAAVVKLTGAAFDINELYMEVNPKVGHYKTTMLALANHQDAQIMLSQYGTQIVSNLDTSEASKAYAWNTDLTMNTEAVTIQGKTFTRTYVWNTDLTIASSSVAVT